MRQIEISKAGAPDVLQLVTKPDATPDVGEVLVEVSYAGVNFMDVGVRQGSLWQETAWPKYPGVEGSGRVLAIGAGVAGLAIGDRVAWIYAPGSYAERLILPASALVALPDNVDDQTAAAVMMQGLTAMHFATEFFPVQPGDTALVHAAAGGLGLILTQIIRLRGGRVIGRVSREEKVRAVRSAGAEEVIVDAGGGFAEQVRALTNGAGVDVVYDGSGPATYQASLDSLRTCGTFCWYGAVLGSPGPIDLMQLPRSIKIGYASFIHSIPTPDRLRENAARLFAWIAEGCVRPEIGEIYLLEDAARAHSDMESRRSTGKLLLAPKG
jgi:NADPH2:quinone reductase